MTIGQLIDAVIAESRKAGIGLESIRFSDHQLPSELRWFLGRHHFIYSFSIRDERESVENPKFVEYLVSRARWSLMQIAKDEHEGKPSAPDDFMKRAMDACSGLS